jgi:hypothetical protein
MFFLDKKVDRAMQQQENTEDVHVQHEVHRHSILQLQVFIVAQFCAVAQLAPVACQLVVFIAEFLTTSMNFG